MDSVPVFILAGGLGTRISEETTLRPKPMIEIGETPVLVHLMRWYYAHGFNDFVILGGYKSWEIKNYFLEYQFRQNHIVIDHRVAGQRDSCFGKNLTQERWRVRVVDTGVECMTGARVARGLDAIAQEWSDEQFTDFALTYGDGLCDVDLGRELHWHREHGKVGTVLAVRPSPRFGELDIGPGGSVRSFLEKPQSRHGSINGGFFLFKRKFRQLLSDDAACVLEQEPLARLATQGELVAFPHDGFWQPMDTLRDKIYLQKLWDEGKAPWVKR